MVASQRYRVWRICLLCFALSICTSSPVFAAERAIKQLDTVLSKTTADQTQTTQCADTAELNRAIEAGNSAKQALVDELNRYKNLQVGAD